jgi:endoglucanase
MGFPADRPEKLKSERNFVGTDVVYLDFHEFTQPGAYVAYVPGIGTSYPFTIGRDAWTEAFKISMMGFLHHRSGIELGPPFTDYVRPRNMHPADGFKVFKLRRTHLDGEASEVFADLKEQLGDKLDATVLEECPGAWGGYMDAGDWDRRVQHLDVSYKQLELFELFPAFFAQLALALPPSEAQDKIPDLLNEVLWNVSFYRRLQEPDGGVRGGIESVSHPRPGEASWQETELLGAFAPDPVASYRYAATAAKLHRALKPFDEADAERYLDTARKAFRWADANGDAVLVQVAERSAKQKLDKLRESSTVERALAAVELYISTDEQRFHDDFKADHVLARGLAPDRGSHALFTYARLADDKVDLALRDKARAAIVQLADTALEFQAGNAFGIATVVPGFPMMGYLGYYSTPGMVLGNPLPEAYILTGDEKYLRGAVAAANYSAGANPLNMTFTVGVGQQYPLKPLHIDSRITGQPAPKGITIYGPMDPDGGFGFNNWVHQWYLQEMTPNSRTWPAAEWHADLPNWPAMSEYTIHQTMGHTAYYWGFLAARETMGGER